MVNPIIQAYDSYWEDEEKRKKKQGVTTTSNPIIDAYEKKYPTQAPVKTPSKVAAEEQKQSQQQPQKNFFQKIGEKVSKTIQDIRGITPEIAKEEISKAPQRFQEQIIKPITNPVDTYNDFLNKGLAKNLEQKYSDIRMEREKDVPNEGKIAKMEKQAQEIEQALALPTTDIKSIKQKYLTGSKYEFGYDTRGAVATLTLLAANTLDFVTKLGENNPMLTSMRDRADKLEETDPEQAAKIREMFALDEKPTTRKVSESMKKWAAEVAPDSPDTLDKLKDGLVSTVPFLVASVLSGGSSAVMAFKMAVLEASGEAGAVYEENRSKGQSVAEASKNADRNFLSNLMIGYFTNKVSFFSDESKLLKRSVNSMTSEAAQEASQQLSSNYFTGKKDDELWEGVLEAAGIGGFSGGVLSLALGGIAVDTTTGERLAGLQESAAAELTGGGFSEQPMGGSAATEEIPQEETVQEVTEQPVQTIEAGITSFRGTPVKTVEETLPYYESTRAKGFENAINNEAPADNITVNNIEKTAGVWEGNIEPSYRVEVEGADTDVLSYFAKLGTKANQDAVVLFAEDSTENGYKYTLTDVGKVDSALGILAKAGIKGATAQDGKIVVYDSDGSLKSAIMAVVKENNYGYKETKGVVRFLTREEYPQYIKAQEKGVGRGVPSKLQTKQEVKPSKSAKRADTISKRITARTVKFREAPVTEQEFKDVVAANSGEAEIKFIDLDTDDFRAARKDVRNGVKSMSNLPILIKEGADGKDIVVDGNHRLAEAIARGETKIRVITDEALYRKLSEMEEAMRARTIRDSKGKFAGSVSYDEKIKQYIKERGTRFRTGEEEILESPTNPRQMTTKFLEHPDIKGKDFISKTYIRNLSNSKGVGLKAYEYSVIQDVLDKDFSNVDKIKMIDFRKAVLNQMMPLDIIPSDTYANYGIDNIGMDYSSGTAEAPKTYILNSPFDHGQTGHFSSDFRRQTLFKEDVEIKEIPVSDRNPTPKFVVIKKGVDLNEANIQENVLNISNSREDAEYWLGQHTVSELGGEKGAIYKVATMTRGLFGHFRVFHNIDDQIASVAEIQSDSFQRGVGTGNEIKSKEEKVFLTYKNIWQERIVREAINLKANEGFKFIRFPTPRTVAAIEGFISDNENSMPYEIVSGSEEGLEVGDIIDYGGEEYTVVAADSYSITVAPSDKVNSFDADTYMEEEIQYQWDENIKYSFGQLEKAFGKIETIADVKKVLDANGVLEQLHRFAQIDKDVANENTGWLQDSTQLKERIANGEGLIEETKRFKKLIESGVIEKEGITKDNAINRIAQTGEQFPATLIPIQGVVAGVFDSTVFYSDKGLKAKYGFDHNMWRFVEDTFRFQANQGDPTKLTLEALDAELERQEAGVEESKELFAKAEKDHNEKIDEIKSRKKPTQKELKGIPQEMIDKAADPSSYGFGYDIDYELENLFNTAVENSEDDTDPFSLDDLEGDWFDQQRNSFNVMESLEGAYNEVFVDGDMVYVITDGNSETFNQPDQYDKPSSIEDFDIENFDNEQKTVLSFYEKQVIPYLKKLRGANLRLIEDDNGWQWWESDLTEVDKLPPTVYRIKDDFKQIGVTITDAQEKEILKLNKKMFGDDSVKITEQILANNKALGSYSAKLIKILSGQANPKDTFYHEAVHKYLDVFSTQNEQIELFNAAIRKYGTDDLNVVEERLAEDFIKYAKAREGVTGKIRSIFDKIISRIQSYFKNKDVINDFYAEVMTPVQQKRAVKKPVTKTAQKRAAQTPPEIPKPIGRGKKKVSRLGLGVEAKAVEADLVEQFADLPEYSQLSTDNQAKRASKMVTDDFDKAVRIALGQEQPPYGLLPESVYIAVENKALADGSVDLLRRLATSVRVSEATAMGQRIRMLAERNPDSVTNRIREVVDARKKAIEESRGTTVKKEAAKIKTEVDNQVKKITKGDWKSFIDSIEC